MSEFDADNITYFKINTKRYGLHNFVIADLDVFSCIFIDKINDLDNILEITFDISAELIENVFHLLYDSKKIYLFDNMLVKDVVQTILFMKYFGLSISMIESVTKSVANNTSTYIDTFITECKEVTYIPELLQFISKCRNDGFAREVVFDEILLEIYNLHFPIEFSIQALNKVIKCDIIKVKFPLNFTLHSGTISFNIISEIYKKYNIDIQHIVKWEKIIDGYATRHSIKYFVNDKEISIIDDINWSFAKNTCNLSLTETIALHITNLLLGFQIL
jgi:hypothetical protein